MFLIFFILIIVSIHDSHYKICMSVKHWYFLLCFWITSPSNFNSSPHKLQGATLFDHLSIKFQFVSTQYTNYKEPCALFCSLSHFSSNPKFVSTQCMLVRVFSKASDNCDVRSGFSSENRSSCKREDVVILSDAN